jgi:two-component system chemotaxis sensor kinase CheA
MNVVKEIVSELNGNVTIETEPSMGTRFVMSFPLTLAIIPAIMVKVVREMYAIPLSDVIETIKISTSDIQTIEGHEVINLRGEILSLLRLNRFMRIKSALGPDQKIPVVVVGYGNRKIGLMVDYLEGKQEIVIKSLEQNYKTVEGLAGASILGDGSICLILDISSMMNKVITEQEMMSDRDRVKLRAGEYFDEADYETAVVEEMGHEKPALTVERPAERSREEKPVVAERTVWEKPAESVKAEPVPAARREEAKARPAAPVPPARGKSAVDSEIENEEDFKIIDEEVTVAARPAAPGDDEIERRVKETLHKFKDELRENIQSTLEKSKPDDYIKEALQMNDDDLDRVRILANMGITHAAENLSKILNKQIDLTIPDVRFIRIDRIPETIGNIDSVYIGVYMPLMGDIKGTILFSFGEESGFDLIDTLWGTETGKTRELTEDGESSLKELGNIVGSSVINVIAEKINMAIKPTVPTVTHDYMQATLDSILIMHSIKSDYALIMETDFFYGDDRVIGNMLILPDTESLKLIVEKLRQ